MSNLPQSNDSKRQKSRVVWLNTKSGCIVAVAVCFVFIAVFVMDIVLNHKILDLVFIALYGMIVSNRLKQLRKLAS